MATMRENLWKWGGMALGAVASWPSPYLALQMLPDFKLTAAYGTGAGFIIGALIYHSKVLKTLTASWHMAWKALACILLTLLWLYLSYELAQLYAANLGTADITDQRLYRASAAAFAISALWSVPLTYLGGLIGEARA